LELVGRRFGHIRVVDLLGQGGMGDVYAGFDEKLQRHVALKVLHSDRRLDAEARDRLLREARALSKLDHPNICRVYDYLEGGDVDLLVLEYIEGTTLEDAASKGLSRAQKLRIAEEIAEVLVAAHRAGIIHRDLKPENVMLTLRGDVKVLDFGLARWLTMISSVRMRVPIQQESADEWYALEDIGATAVVSIEEDASLRRRSFLATQAGVTMGTPMYMSPEQARGHVLTPASDMFSFGLVLQTLFTAREPHPEFLHARDVMLRTARGETTPMTGDRDVVALVNRLKQLAPSDRPTAGEALALITRIIDKPKRIVRRIAIAVLALILIGGSWRYVVDLRKERAIALAAQAEAQRGRAQAESLLEFMLGDLRRKLEPVGRLDVLEDAAQRSLGYFTSLDASSLSVADLIRNAKGLHQLGDVRIAQGKLDDAMIAFQRSLLLAEEAKRKEPWSADAQLAVGTSHFFIGNAYRMRADLTSALAHLTQYMNAGEQLAAAHPDNDEYRLERAQGHGNVATILDMQGDLRGALAHNRVALEIKKARLDAAPADADRRAEYATTLNKVGLVLRRLGDMPAALSHFEQEFAIDSSLAANDPLNSKWKQKGATCRSYIAVLLENMGRDEEAFQQRTAELKSEQELHDSDPANVDWQRNLAITQSRLADLLRRRGDTRAATVWVSQAESLMRDLVQRPAARATWSRDLGVIRMTAARISLRAKSNAIGAIDEAIRLLESPPPAEPAGVRLLAEALVVRGEALAAAGRNREAKESWTRAREVIEPIARTTTDPSILDIDVRAVVCAGGNPEPLLQRLESLGYRHRDLVALVNQRRAAAKGE